MKGEVTIDLIAQFAGDIADNEGLEKLTVKAVAEKLEIKPPSLMFHVKNLNGLKSILGQHTIKVLVAELLRAGFGKSGLEAVVALGKASMDFAVRHPGMYESIQWFNAYAEPRGSDEPDARAFQQITELFFELFKGSKMPELEVSHIIRGFRSLIHGFATIAGHKGFGHPSDIVESFEYCLELFLNGVKMKLHEAEGN
ncbi:TetR family transcriptional regulator [Clostridia bacterium]|nr:TetR family transcriptional regulator [Clostridia bacterium]